MKISRAALAFGVVVVIASWTARVCVSAEPAPPAVDARRLHSALPP